VITFLTKDKSMQQSKTNGHQERIAAQNAAIVRRNMPQVIISRRPPPVATRLYGRCWPVFDQRQ